MAKNRRDIQQAAEVSTQGTAQGTLDERRREARIPTNDSASLQLLSTLERFDVQVLDVSRNGFRIRTPRFLGSGAIVQIELRDMAITGEVRYCVQKEDGFSAGLYIQDCVERRESQRLPVDISGTIGELQNDQAVRIVDQSKGGMLLETQHWIPRGTAVRIIAGGKLTLATVVHCNRDGGTFKIGVKIDHRADLVEIGRSET